MGFRLAKITFFQLRWALRYALYRLLYGLGGGWSSYLGRPLFHNGLRRLRVEGSLGVFPNWRIEFLGNGALTVQGRVRIGQNFHCIVGGDIHIDDGTTLAPEVYISSYESRLGEIDKAIPDRSIKSDPVHVGRHVFIGRGAMIFPGVTVGDNAVIGAYSIVKQAVPAGTFYVGVKHNRQKAKR